MLTKIFKWGYTIFAAVSVLFFLICTYYSTHPEASFREDSVPVKENILIVTHSNNYYLCVESSTISWNSDPIYFTFKNIENGENITLSSEDGTILSISNNKKLMITGTANFPIGNYSIRAHWLNGDPFVLSEKSYLQYRTGFENAMGVTYFIFFFISLFFAILFFLLFLVSSSFSKSVNLK